MSDTSFLPEDYVAKKAERRTTFVCLVLFVVVMAAVVGAFLVTNEQWTQVKDEQARINTEYQAVALRISELNELEKQKDEMLHKAELAAALIERVPRSILMAEIINRMPQRLSLLDVSLSSEKVQSARHEQPASTGNLSGGGKPSRGKTKTEAAADNQRVEAPRYRIKMSIVGVAPTDLEVSRFLANLNSFDLLTGATLDYVEEKKVNEVMMREFRLNTELVLDADVRDIEPIIKRRMDPMEGDISLGGSPLEEGN